MMLSSAKTRIGDRMLLFMSFMYHRKRTSPRTEACGTPDVTHVLPDRDPLTETVCLRCDFFYFIQFLVFPVIP